MSYGQQTYMAAPQQRSTDDRATWALIAVLVLLVAGGAGWLVARASNPSTGDVENITRVAQQEAALQGRQAGWSEGAKLGRREARLQGEYQALRQQRSAWSSGWSRGLQDGRTQANARQDGLDGYDPIYSGASADAFPEAGYQDVMNDLFTDPPGYASSSLSGTGSYGAPGSSAAESSISELFGNR